MTSHVLGPGDRDVSSRRSHRDNLTPRDVIVTFVVSEKGAGTRQLMELEFNPLGGGGGGD